MTEHEAEVHKYLVTIAEMRVKIDSLRALLREARRGHPVTFEPHGGCRKVWHPSESCTCGADEFNDRIDEALNG